MSEVVSEAMSEVVSESVSEAVSEAVSEVCTICDIEKDIETSGRHSELRFLLLLAGPS